jgi:hypothetical protein
MAGPYVGWEAGTKYRMFFIVMVMQTPTRTKKKGENVIGAMTGFEARYACSAMNGRLGQNGPE